MLRRQANRRATAGGQRLALALAAVAIVASAGAWWRWERSPELVRGVPRPVWGRVTEMSGTAPPERPGDDRGTCAIEALVEGPSREVVVAYAEQLRRRGWDELGGSGLRMRFRDGRRRLTLRAEASPEEPGWSRLQIEVERCHARP